MRYEYEKEDSSAANKLTYLLIGGGIGAVLALLFAPKSGEELRADISDATRKGLEKSKETAAQLQERAGEYYEVTRDKAGELYSTAQDKAGAIYSTAQDKAGEIYSTAQDKASALYSTAQEKVGDLKDKAGELSDKAKSAATSANPLTAAIEAGKEEYNNEKRRTESKAISEGRPSYPVENKGHKQ